MRLFGDETIKTGDMTVVVRDCCGRYLGRIVKVGTIFRVTAPEQWAVCGTCNREYSNIAVVEAANSSLNYAPLFWLKKLPPVTEHETTDEREDIREPA